MEVPIYPAPRLESEKLGELEGRSNSWPSWNVWHQIVSISRGLQISKLAILDCGTPQHHTWWSQDSELMDAVEIMLNTTDFNVEWIVQVLERTGRDRVEVKMLRKYGRRARLFFYGRQRHLQLLEPLGASEVEESQMLQHLEDIVSDPDLYCQKVKCYNTVKLFKASTRMGIGVGKLNLKLLSHLPSDIEALEVDGKLEISSRKIGGRSEISTLKLREQGWPSLPSNLLIEKSLVELEDLNSC